MGAQIIEVSRLLSLLSKMTHKIEGAQWVVSYSLCVNAPLILTPHDIVLSAPDFFQAHADLWPELETSQSYLVC